MNLLQFLIIAVLAIDIHMKKTLYLSNLTVPPIIDASHKAKLSCSYEMGTIKLNSVKWYKDGQEFFRYSPMTPPTINWFPVAGVTVDRGSFHCNQFLCNVELEKLNVNSSGSYRCEVSGDAPEFILIDKTANMTVGVLPKFEPYISGIKQPYTYGERLEANCSSGLTSPPTILSWLINNETISSASLLPQINENTRRADGFVLTASTLPLSININKNTSEVLRLKCIALIKGHPDQRREHTVHATILTRKDVGNNQRQMGFGLARPGHDVGSARAIILGALVLLLSHQALWNAMNISS